jgi:ribonuclease HII
MTHWREEAKNHSYIVGADECGWGAWAGPIVVCAAVVPVNWTPPTGLNDSKKIRKSEHERLFYILKDTISYQCEMAQPDEIDRDGPVLALKRCYRVVVRKLLESFPEALVILDGEVNIRADGIQHLSFPRADGEVPAVMAASVLGKYTHDRYMLKLAEEYPGYGFAKHVGYGTPEHRAAIEKKGMCSAHRRSYVPMGKLSGEEMAQANDEGMVIDE